MEVLPPPPLSWGWGDIYPFPCWEDNPGGDDIEQCQVITQTSSLDMPQTSDVLCCLVMSQTVYLTRIIAVW